MNNPKAWYKILGSIYRCCGMIVRKENCFQNILTGRALHYAIPKVIVLFIQLCIPSVVFGEPLENHSKQMPQAQASEAISLPVQEGQNQGLSKYFTMSLEDLAKVQIIGSTLTEQALKTVPSAVTVFTHEQIKRMGLDSLDELMNLVPGFQSYRSSQTSMSFAFSSRGRRIGNPVSEIMILVDNQLVNEPRTSGSALFVTNCPLMHIERIEFIRGPGAAVYGSNAMMGVVNIVTRTDVNELSVGYGSFNRRQAYLLASQQIGDVKMDLFGRIDADDGDDYLVQDTFGPDRIYTDDPRKRANLNAKIRWHDTYLNLQYNQLEAENFYEQSGISNGFNQRSVELGSISLQQDFNWLSVSSSVWISYFLSNANSTAQFAAPGVLAGISNPASNDALFVDVDFTDYSETRFKWHNDWHINDQSSLQFGIELRHIDVPETIVKNNFDLGDLANRNFPIRYYGSLLATTAVQAESNRDIVGLYSQYQRLLFEKTSLILGLRYDKFSSIGSQLSPRLGLVQELSDHHSLKLLYGEAFRAPSENELNLTNTPDFLGNPDLKPEIVKTWELIWMGQWSHTNISLGYFENHFKDSIAQTATGTGALQYNNVYQDPAKGLEFELSHELNEHWLLRATYTYISDKPELSFREAEQLTSLMVNFQQGKWNANLIATWCDEREMLTGGSGTSRISLNDYWQLFGKVNYNFNHNWRGFVQVKNMSDEDYLTPASSSKLTEGIPNRGREIMVGVIWHF